ncbi:peptide deformylase [bacterium]|nr:peptide deformylase [Candidatus Elulimicrobium humile]
MSDIIEAQWNEVDENGNPIAPKRKLPIVEESFDKRVTKIETPTPTPTPEKQKPIEVPVDIIQTSDGKNVISPIQTKGGLIHWNHPLLKKPCSLWDFEKKTVEEAAQLGILLIKISRELGGAGLSANQIGVDAKVFVLTVVENHHFAVFNPEIIESSVETSMMEEGCLSRPGLWLKITRPESIKVKYRTFKNEEVITQYNGYVARVFQHEYDHMLGIDFTQRVGKLKLDLALKRMDRQIRKMVTEKNYTGEGRLRPIIKAE